MEFNSIYVKETTLNEENKFTLNFSSENEVKDVIFHPDLNYFITTLDANIKLDENKAALKSAVKNSDVWDDILKLSKLSNELATKGADYQNDIKTILLKIQEFGLVFQTENFDLILDNNIIDVTSFKYQYYDVDEDKFKEGKIYNPYKHFREIGMSFKTSRNSSDNKVIKAKLNLKNNQITYTMNFDRKLFDFDTFYIAKNQFFVFDQVKKNNDWILCLLSRLGKLLLPIVWKETTSS